MASSSLLFPIPLAAIRGDIPHLPLISFRECSLELTGMVNWWASQCGPILPARWYVGDKSSPSCWCDHKGWFSDSLSVWRTWGSHLAFMCLSPSSSSNYACAVSWVCKWTSGWCIYLWHVTACTYFLSSLKEGSGSLEFNTFSLCHFPSASRGISNDSAWLLHAAVQLCDTFKWRELAVTEPWLSSCAPETFFLLLFFFFAGYLPTAKSVWRKESLQLQETQRPITFGVKLLPLSEGEFLHHREKHCWQNCSLKDSNYLQATINCGPGLITSSTDPHPAFKDLCCAIILRFLNLRTTSSSLLCLRSLKYVTCIFVSGGYTMRIIPLQK